MGKDSRRSVLIVDDYPATRVGLHEVLNRGIPGLTFVQAGNAPQALECIWKEKFDLILLDLFLEGRSRLDLVHDIKRHAPESPILIVSSFDENLYAVRALSAGASGYLNKDSPIEELVQAALQVLAGEIYVGAKVAKALAANLGKKSDRPLFERLSPREFEVLCLIGKGKAMKEIAAELHLSIKTVSTYRTRVLKAMDLKSTADLIRYCIRTKLCDD